MTEIRFTQTALRRLSPEEKMEVRVAIFRDGSIKGWTATSTDRVVAWHALSESIVVGFPDEAPSFSGLVRREGEGAEIEEDYDLRVLRL